MLCPYASYAVNTHVYLKDLKSAHEDIKTVEKCMKNQNCDENCQTSLDNLVAMQDKLDDLEKDFNERKDEILTSVDKFQSAAEKHGRDCASQGRKSVLHCTDLRTTDKSTCQGYYEIAGKDHGGSYGVYTTYSFCTYTSGNTCSKDKSCGKGASHKYFNDLKKVITAMSIQKGVPTKRIEALKDQKLRKQVQEAEVLSDTYKETIKLNRDNKTLIKKYDGMCQ